MDLEQQSLKALLAKAHAASPGKRIEYRDPIAAHGSAAIDAMLSWSADRRFAGFAVRVVSRIGQTGSHDEARTALENLRAIVPTDLIGDIETELRRLDRQPVGPLRRPPPVQLAKVEADTAGLGWVAALEPVGATEVRGISGGAMITIVPLSFPLWVGPELTMSEDCNKKGGRVRGDLDELSCGEVEVVKRFRRAGWNAYWVSAWHCGERLWGPYRAQPDALPTWVQARERELRKLLPDELRKGKGGRPDVVAWARERLVYVESKGPGDNTKHQEQWLSAAAIAGFTEQDLGIAEWFALP